MIFRTFLDELLLFFYTFLDEFRCKVSVFFSNMQKIDGESDFFRLLSPKMLRETIVLHIGAADLVYHIYKVGQWAQVFFENAISL